jgi:hypothetical protein
VPWRPERGDVEQVEKLADSVGETADKLLAALDLEFPLGQIDPHPTPLIQVRTSAWSWTPA